MLSLLSKLKEVEKSVTQAKDASNVDRTCLDTAPAKPNEEGWLRRENTQHSKDKEVPTYDTTVIPVPKDKLVWAKCAGFKSHGRPVYFPARLCDNTEILNYCTVEEWPIPSSVAVVEYFDIPKNCVYHKVVQVKKADTRPYYFRYKSRTKLTPTKPIRKYSVGSNEGTPAGSSDNESADEFGISSIAYTLQDYQRWDPETMEQMHARLLDDNRYSRTEAERIFQAIRGKAELFLHASTEFIISPTEEESSPKDNLHSDPGAARLPDQNHDQVSNDTSDSEERIGRYSVSGKKRKIKEVAPAEAARQRSKGVRKKCSLRVGDWIRVQDKVFKDIAQVVRVKRINLSSEMSHVIEYEPNGTLDYSDHICLVSVDGNGVPTSKSEYHGLVADFRLIPGGL